MKKSVAILKKLPLKMTLATAALFFFITSQALGNSQLRTTFPSSPNKLLVIGHRGAAGLAPENTLAAFKKALNLGVDAIELDVHISADKILVVYHDFTLKPEITRTSDGEWLDMWAGLLVKNLSLAELKGFDVGRMKPHTGYARRYPDQTSVDGERIPTLKEVIQLIRSLQNKTTRLWIEIKTSPENTKASRKPESVARAVVNLLNRENFSKRVKILSFDWRALVHVQKIAPEIPTVYLSRIGNRLNNIKPGQPGPSPWTAGIDIDNFNGSIPLAIKAAGGRFWAPYYKYVTSDNIREAHGLGISVFVWTPDRKNDLLRLLKMGVDGIITNRPDILKSILRN